MLIEIDISRLEELNLTADEYIFLTLISEQKYNSAVNFLHNMVKHGSNLEVFVKILKDKGYVVKCDLDLTIPKILLERSKLFELLNLKETYVYELLVTYPMKVPNGKGGTRGLRPTSLTTKLGKDIEAKYKRIVKGNPNIHSHIMRCLNIELDMRRRSGAMQYMPELETYLNGQLWQKYEYLLETSATTEVEKYGEQVI